MEKTVYICDKCKKESLVPINEIWWGCWRIDLCENCFEKKLDKHMRDFGFRDIL